MNGCLEDLVAGRCPDRGVLFYGPRGTGKTALLTCTRDRARRLGLRAEPLSPAALTRDDRLTTTLQAHAGVAARRITGAQVGPFGASVEREPLATNVSHLLRTWISRESPPLVILLDEVHTLAPATARDFFAGTQAAMTERLPFFLVAAGAPQAPRRLRKAGTFTERMLLRAPVGRLTPEAAREALARPAAESGRPFDRDALDCVARASQNYPFFLQLLGSAAWRNASGAAGIGSHAARRGIAESRREIERFYHERFLEAKERRILPALVAVALALAESGGTLNDAELDAVLDRAAAPDGDPIQLMMVLRDLGVIWDSVPGQWGMGIPSFAGHVLRRMAPDALRKATHVPVRRTRSSDIVSRPI